MCWGLVRREDWANIGLFTGLLLVMVMVMLLLDSAGVDLSGMKSSFTRTRLNEVKYVCMSSSQLCCFLISHT
jgi:hypothetical protein